MSEKDVAVADGETKNIPSQNQLNMKDNTDQQMEPLNVKQKGDSQAKEKEQIYKPGERVEMPETVPLPYNLNANFQSAFKEALEKKGKLRYLGIVDPEMNDEEIEKKELEIKEDEENKLNLDKSGEDIVDDQMAQLHLCKKAYLDQYYELSDLMVCCALYRRYRLSLEYGEKAYHFYNLKEEADSSCGHDCCPNQCRGFHVNADYYRLKDGTRDRNFFVFNKLFRCGVSCLCSCCSRPTLEVITQGGQLIGRIIEQRTFCSPTIMIYYKQNRNPTWKISGRCSQCGYCCRDLCAGCCSEATFYIYKAMDEENVEFGSIVKKNEYGKVWKPDCERIEINFPEIAVPEEKVLIIGGTLMMLYMYYQNSKVRTRCHNN